MIIKKGSVLETLQNCKKALVDTHIREWFIHYNHITDTIEMKHENSDNHSSIKFRIINGVIKKSDTQLHKATQEHSATKALHIYLHSKTNISGIIYD